MISFWSVSDIQSLTKNAGIRDSVRKDDQTLSRDKDLKQSPLNHCWRLIVNHSHKNSSHLFQSERKARPLFPYAQR